MTDKPNARELLKEAQDWIKGICDIYADELGAGMSNTGEAIMVKIDAFLAAPDESAMEMVRQIRDLESYGGGDYEYYLDATDAAALIEGLQRRVPRAMLDKVYFASLNTDFPYAEERELIDAIAAKHGVVIE